MSTGELSPHIEPDFQLPNIPIPPLPKSREKVVAAQRLFLSIFRMGGIGIFGSRKSGSKCGESSPVDIRCAVFNGGIQYASPNIIGGKSDCGTSSFSPLLFYIATTFQAIDTLSQCDIIQESKNADADQAHGLTSACIFRFLRREPSQQKQIVRHPKLHLTILYRTGGNNQLEPQKEAHKQFRYSATRKIIRTLLLLR